MLTFRIIKYLGVSKFNSTKDYYKILKISSSASQADIKKSYHQLAKKYHPDANQGREDMFKEVNQAYQILSEESTKRQYDESRNPTSSHSQSNFNNQYTRGNYNQNKNTYRGYQRQEGWNDQRYRERVMEEIFKAQQQSQKYQSKFSHDQNLRRRSESQKHFEEKFYRHAENIRKYNPEMKIKQEEIRKAYEQEQKRRQREFEQYKDKQKINVGEILQKKIGEMAEGFKDNISGVKKVGTFMKSFWDDIKKKK